MIEWILSGLEHEWLIECFFLRLECFDGSSAESHLVLQFVVSVSGGVVEEGFCVLAVAVVVGEGWIGGMS